MNFSDSEIVASILAEEGYSPTREMELAQLILVNTCSIREKAEDTVRQRLTVFNKFKRQSWCYDRCIGLYGRKDEK